ncbi:unnamed protein product [Mytilus coruscus]|uniref:Ig-like domain-containing protein n=1 Tax=Mytilus coruscus TaxID=42192 RepID=A0A6J8D1B3_MYTCO|nr:unnamed protein product [Mytilus coruscus]
MVASLGIKEIEDVENEDQQTNNNIKEEFATIGFTKVLKCPVSQDLQYKWENDNDTIVIGESINPDLHNLNKFTIDRQPNEYNLNISNITTAGKGKYCCEQKMFRCCIQLHVKEVPEVSVIQLDNGSLLCSTVGFPDNIRYSMWEHKSPSGKHLRYLKGTQNGILNLDTLDGNIGLDTTYSLDGMYICQDINHMAEERRHTFRIWV